MRGERIRERLHMGERVYGSHVCSLTNPTTAVMQAGFSYDFMFICTEHMPLNRAETAMMCRLYAAHGISPIVRIPYPDAHEAAMALDAGAEGIVAPYVETVEEVKQLVGAVKYRPIKGKMLRDLLDGTRVLPPHMQEFLAGFNRHTYLIIGVESVAAYENLDALLAVDGVDGIFVGPHDMSVTMEIPEQYDHPDFRRVLQDIVGRSREKSLGVGIHFGPGVVTDETIAEFVEIGMNWVLYGADITVLRSAMEERLAAFRERMGDVYERGDVSDIRPLSPEGISRPLAEVRNSQ